MKSESTTSEHHRRKAAASPKPDPAFLKLVSYLLQYPDDAFLAELPDLKAVIDHWPDPMVCRSLRQFCDRLTAMEPLKIQEAYTAAFDLNPKTCMNLTYHLWGDDEKRGRMLAQVQQIYVQTGYECARSELPDHLPLVLEFCSQQPQWVGDALFARLLGVLDPLAKDLSAIESPYARIFELTARLLNPAEADASGKTAKSRSDSRENSS